MKVKIYYHHTDAAGVVYYANYLKFLEEARTEFLAEKGISIQKLSVAGLLFAVSRQEIDYKSPSFYGDILDIETKLLGITGARMEFEHRITKQAGVLVSQAKTVLVCIGKDFKPRALPPDLKEKL